MNVQRNPKTFNYLFTLFVKMGEERLGRRLTADEINKLRPSIAKKCENINKKDIVREIYNLEKSRREQEKGHLSLKEKMDLRKKISTATKCPVKYTSSSDDLVKAVSNSFANIHISDALKRNPNLKLKAPEILNAEKRKLKDSYINDQFHYKAPLSLSDKLKRWTALGLVGATAIGIIGHEVLFKDQNIPKPEETTITETTQPTFSTSKEYLESQLDDTSLLTHFKEVLANEFNEKFDYDLSYDNFTVELKTHTFIYKLTNKAGNVFYITKGDSPAYVEKLLPQAGYTCQRVAANDDGSDLIKLSGNGVTIACAENENGDLVGIDGFGWDFTNHQPSQEELNSGYSNILNSDSNGPSQLLADICSTSAFDAVRYNDKTWYIESLLEYIENHPDSQLTQEVNSAIKESKNSQTKTNATHIEIEDDGRDY